MLTRELERPQSYEAPREILGSRAFNLEYRERPGDKKSVRNDIISYLGEYRFEIDTYKYDLFYSSDMDSGEAMIMAQDGEPMLAKSKRALRERQLRGDPTHREENETLGLASIERQLKYAQNGDSIFWASPPGLASEGYGDYGFIYHGRKEGSKVAMKALRVNSPTISEFNQAMTKLTREEFKLDSADSFLRTPKLVKGNISGKYVEHVLKQYFSFEADFQSQRRFEEIIAILEPLIERVVNAIQYGEDKESKLNTFYALENYAIELRDKKEKLMDLDRIYFVTRQCDVDEIVAKMSFTPPVVRGSCGSTNAGNGIFSSISSITGTNGLLDLREPFECPKCSYTTTSPIGNRCPGCGLTKEQYAEEMGGEVCD